MGVLIASLGWKIGLTVVALIVIGLIGYFVAVVKGLGKGGGNAS